MSTPNYVGYWIGTFTGTNSGGLTVDIRESSGALSGIAKFSEPALGQYEYRLNGSASEPLSLHLVPARTYGSIQLGTLQVVGTLQADGSLSGRWKSTIGTEGVFTVTRHETDTETAQLPKQNSVFLVHGHDEGAKHGVARFLEQLGVQPVILQEQINRGMTVIEKFEDFASRAGFAVVLMTPDDFGYPVAKEEEKKHRPRQNVVLELGFSPQSSGARRRLCLPRVTLKCHPTYSDSSTSQWIDLRVGRCNLRVN
jgi:Predicted nucleotide-binding protein containing TIR-like domain